MRRDLEAVQLRRRFRARPRVAAAATRAPERVASRPQQAKLSKQLPSDRKPTRWNRSRWHCSDGRRALYEAPRTGSAGGARSHQLRDAAWNGWA